MAKNKTTATESSVTDFLLQLENEQKRLDSLRLIAWMKELTGCEPVLWGPNIIGFGNYHYRYDSGHEGDAPVTAFSPRKAAFSLYVYTGLPEHEFLLKGLGKFTMGKACIYVKKLSDIDEEVLKNLIRYTIHYLKERYGGERPG